MKARLRSFTTLGVSLPMGVGTVINAVKLRNAGRAVAKVQIQSKLARAWTKTTGVYQQLTTNLASRSTILTKYIELMSICFSGMYLARSENRGWGRGELF